MGLIKQCPQCGKSFQYSRSTRIYCSNNCYLAAKYQKIKDERDALKTVKICPQCGNEFLGTKKKIYCSQKCQARVNYDRKNAKECNQITRVCECCGKTFTTYLKGKVVCSDECKEIMREKMPKRKNTMKHDSEALIRKNDTAISQGMSYGKYQALHSGLIPTAEDIIAAYRGGGCGARNDIKRT